MKLPTDRTAVASIKRSNQWPKPKNLSDSINYLGTLGLNDESSEEISHTNCDKDTKNIFFELFIYLCWLAPLQYQIFKFRMTQRLSNWKILASIKK
jgi:hypothetical protein